VARGLFDENGDLIVERFVSSLRDGSVDIETFKTVLK
jgi:hypothetical protein